MFCLACACESSPGGQSFNLIYAVECKWGVGRSPFAARWLGMLFSMHMQLRHSKQTLLKGEKALACVLHKLIATWPFKYPYQTIMTMKPEIPEWQTKFQRVLDAAHENKFVQVATVSQQRYLHALRYEDCTL